jgi:hypothetical protein
VDAEGRRGVSDSINYFIEENFSILCLWGFLGFLFSFVFLSFTIFTGNMIPEPVCKNGVLIYVFEIACTTYLFNCLFYPYLYDILSGCKVLLALYSLLLNLPYSNEGF